MRRKSQSSFEFLTIFGIGFALILILGGIFVSISTESKNALDEKQLNKIGNDLIKTVEEIYFRGSGNKVQYKATFPEGIERISIYHSSNGTHEFDYLNISYEAGGEVRTNVYLTNEFYVRFNCTLCTHNNISNFSYYDTTDTNGGPKTLSVQSKGSWVNVDFVR